MNKQLEGTTKYHQWQLNNQESPVSNKGEQVTFDLKGLKNGQDSHYVFIKDFNRLMYLKTKHQHKKHFCMSCSQNFTTKEILNNHRERYLLLMKLKLLNMKQE